MLCEIKNSIISGALVEAMTNPVNDLIRDEMAEFLSSALDHEQLLPILLAFTTLGQKSITRLLNVLFVIFCIIRNFHNKLKNLGYTATN